MFARSGPNAPSEARVVDARPRRRYLAPHHWSEISMATKKKERKKTPAKHEGSRAQLPRHPGVERNIYLSSRKGQSLGGYPAHPSRPLHGDRRGKNEQHLTPSRMTQVHGALLSRARAIGRAQGWASWESLAGADGREFEVGPKESGHVPGAVTTERGRALAGRWAARRARAREQAKAAEREVLLRKAEEEAEAELRR